MSAPRSDSNPRWWGLIENLPKCSAVYAVFAGKRLLYIGETRLLYIRMRQHHLRRKFIALGADHIEWIECGMIERELMEAWLITKHKPPLNQRGIGMRL